MSEEKELTGVVKTYNGVKGYGFITGSSLPQGDVMFGRDALPLDAKEVQGHFLEGREVIFDAKETADGRWRAISVHIPFVEGQRVAGKIKSFSERNGYGFIGSSSLENDVHFKASVLPPLMPGTPLKDEFVQFEVQMMPDGKLTATKVTFQSKKIAMEKMMGGAMMGMMGGMDMMNMMGAMMQPMMQPTKPAAASVPPRKPAPVAAASARPPPRAQAMPMAPARPAPSSAPTVGRDEATGTVKSYSEKNGYGFINIPGMPVDIKFGVHDLPWTQGVMSVAPGSQVSFICSQDASGRFLATNVKPKGMAAAGGIKRPASAPAGGARPWVPAVTGGAYASSGMNPKMMPAQKMQRTQFGHNAPQTGAYMRGTIQSYNNLKGFGFIASPGLPGDAFFQKFSLPVQAQEQTGMALQGTPVRFEMAQTPDGKIRALNITLEA
eukprot:gb/GFBE01077159.1/.p1 GENE.gb/GFBE01077159.1/~~gb/GFBE01077159.1/.p1  ORF type:complete len:437 (+),score=101.50 gb/GFBE01077159.1/:1-1311(+)